MIELSLLEALAAFSGYHTLVETARNLHTSQPALTRSMKKLENELGLALFHRSKNRLELNETGEFAASCALRLLEENRAFETQVRSFDRKLHTISIGYCAPLPQSVLTPVMNSLFDEMTISADMKEDSDFPDRLLDGTYALAITHYPLSDSAFCCKKCGHEDLFLSVSRTSPFAERSEISLSELDGQSILLLSSIGFWLKIPRAKAPHARFLLQIQQESFSELAFHSDYPCFSSSYYLRRGQVPSDKVHLPIADAECHTDYYLSCLKENEKRFAGLFAQVDGRMMD